MIAENAIIATMVSARQRRGLTQTQLAERTGYHVNSIRRWEVGSVGVPLHAWIDWCHALGVTPRQVLAWAAARGRAPQAPTDT